MAGLLPRSLALVVLVGCAAPTRPSAPADPAPHPTASAARADSDAAPDPAAPLVPATDLYQAVYGEGERYVEIQGAAHNVFVDQQGPFVEAVQRLVDAAVDTEPATRATLYPAVAGRANVTTL